VLSSYFESSSITQTHGTSCYENGSTECHSERILGCHEDRMSASSDIDRMESEEGLLGPQLLKNYSELLAQGLSILS
jgi:hypothetical protein